MDKLSKRQLQRIKHFFREKEERAEERAGKFLHRAPSGDARRRVPIASLMAEKVDQVMIVTSFVEPPLKTGLIDRFLVMAGAERVDPVIIFNKADLLVSRGESDEVPALYRSLGYPVLRTSTVTGEGIGALAEYAAGRTSLLAGHSGVGKTSLLNSLQPGLARKPEVREVSGATGKGRHTTTSVKLYRIDAGTIIFDLPGMKLASLAGVESNEVRLYFPEFGAPSRRCRFDDCLHLEEPECGVKEALQRGEIARLRFESYLRIARTPEAEH